MDGGAGVEAEGVEVGVEGAVGGSSGGSSSSSSSSRSRRLYLHQATQHTHTKKAISWFGLFHKKHKTKFVTAGGTYASHLLPMHYNLCKLILVIQTKQHIPP